MEREIAQKNNLEIIRNALIKKLGSSVADIVPLSSEDIGDHSSVFTGVYEGQHAIIKVGQINDSFREEAAVLSLMQRHDIPCPNVLKVEDELGEITQPILIETRVEGTSLAGLSESGNISFFYEDAGRIMRRMHDIPMGKFGDLKVEDSTLVGVLDSWQEYMQTYVRQIQYCFDQGFINTDERQRLSNVLQEILDLQIQQGFLLHGDYHSMHIFSDGTKITGIIDPGYPKSGDPRWDLAYAWFFLSPQERLHFNAGYGEHSVDPMIEKYLLMIAVDKVNYRHKNGFTDRIGKAVAILRSLLE